MARLIFFLIMISFAMASTPASAVWESLSEISYIGKACDKAPTPPKDVCPDTGFYRRPAQLLTKDMGLVSENAYLANCAEVRKEAHICAKSELDRIASAPEDFDLWAKDVQIKTDALAFYYRRIEEISDEIMTSQRAQQNKLTPEAIQKKRDELREMEGHFLGVYGSIPFNHLSSIQEFIMDRIVEQKNDGKGHAVIADEALRIKNKSVLRAAMDKTRRNLEKDLLTLDHAITSNGNEMDRELKESLAQDTEVTAAVRARNQKSEAPLTAIACRVDSKFGIGAQKRDENLMIASVAGGAVAAGVPRLAGLLLLGRASSVTAGVVSGTNTLARVTNFLYRVGVTYLPAGVNATALANEVTRSCPGSANAQGLNSGSVRCEDYSIRSLPANNCVLSSVLAITGAIPAASNAIGNLKNYLKNKPTAAGSPTSVVNGAKPPPAAPSKVMKAPATPTTTHLEGPPVAAPSVSPRTPFDIKHHPDPDGFAAGTFRAGGSSTAELSYSRSLTPKGEPIIELNYVNGDKNQKGVGQALKQALLDEFPQFTIASKLADTNTEYLMKMMRGLPLGKRPTIDELQAAVPAFRFNGYNYEMIVDEAGYINLYMRRTPNGTTTLTISDSSLKNLQRKTMNYQPQNSINY